MASLGDDLNALWGCVSLRRQQKTTRRFRTRGPGWPRHAALPRSTLAANLYRHRDPLSGAPPPIPRKQGQSVAGSRHRRRGCGMVGEDHHCPLPPKHSFARLRRIASRPRRWRRGPNAHAKPSLYAPPGSCQAPGPISSALEHRQELTTEAQRHRERTRKTIRYRKRDVRLPRNQPGDRSDRPVPSSAGVLGLRITSRHAR